MPDPLPTDLAVSAAVDQLAASTRRHLPTHVDNAKTQLAECLGDENRATAAVYLTLANTLGVAGSAALAAAALVALAQMERVDDVLREHGFEYPLGARGVRDLASQAAGRLEDLERAQALIVKVRQWRSQYLAAMAGNHDGILTANETLMAELGAYDAVRS